MNVKEKTDMDITPYTQVLDPPQLEPATDPICVLFVVFQSVKHTHISVKKAQIKRGDEWTGDKSVHECVCVSVGMSFCTF